MLKRAFTLIELLVAVAIIAILAAIVFPMVAMKLDQSAPPVAVLVKVEDTTRNADGTMYIKTAQKQGSRVFNEIMRVKSDSVYGQLAKDHYYRVEAQGRPTEGNAEPPYRKIVKVDEEVPESNVQ